MTRVRVGALRHGGAAAPPLTPPPPPVATKLLSEGPAPRKSYYLFTVCAASSRFLPALPLPNPPFCSETTLPFPSTVPAFSSLGAGTQTAVGVEAQGMLGGARFLPLKTQGPLPKRSGQGVDWWAAVGIRVCMFACLVRGLAHQCVPCLAGVIGGCGACRRGLPLAIVITGIWPLGFQWVFSATIPPQFPIPSSRLGDFSHPTPHPSASGKEPSFTHGIPTTSLRGETTKGLPAPAAGAPLLQ